MRRGAQGSLLDSLFVWWTAGGGRSAVVSCSPVDLVCWIMLACRACVLHVASGVTWNSPERVDLPSFCNFLLNEFQEF